ncbi:putative ciliary rootlet coiled-coil protein 2 [Scaptodrosophila lebanonensis]|uniref:Ciliary rootlet coiled-coil protein 2 n=1 Tax=Drosophila lebanonensis TaxID=7225 RepID=A0A6J2U519_DROLE|nr:putative ciliary rootlet coiled-coil protein 2 [Scaptodrosophila lebanonensis]XP_030383454.1 putative ciliary rootlet coiled-coil protein 2 [Scaptodrosophila lebanonensis]
MGNAESSPHSAGEAAQSAAAQEGGGVAGSNSNNNNSNNNNSNNNSSSSNNDEPWWQEIEHENLILEQLPSAVLAYSTRNENESETVPATSMLTTTLMLPKKEESMTTLTSNENQSEGTSTTSTVEMESQENGSNSHVGAVCREQTLEEFKEELRGRRLARQTAVQDLREELHSLRKQLATSQAEAQRLRKCQNLAEQSENRDEDASNADARHYDDDADNNVDVIEAEAEAAMDSDDENPIQRSRHANIELANAQLALQLANADNLSLRSELDVVQKQVGTLKEVISCCKQMLSVKEEQCTQLKDKLQEIETSFSEREMKIMSNNLRQEYERQLVNIRQLRQLYEERQRVAAAEYENLQRLISIKKDELIAEQEKTKNLEERNQTLLKEVEGANNELARLKEECSEHKFEKRALKEEMGAVNMLFSQMVMGFNGKNNLDIDRLTKMLEENRDLLNEMTQAEGSCSDGATLPKLLFELVEQAAMSEAKDKSRSVTPTPTPMPTSMPNISPEESNASATGDTVAADAGKVGMPSGCGSSSGSGSVSDSASSAAVIASEDITDFAGCARTSSSSNIGGIKKHRRRSGAAAVSLKSHEPEIMGKVATAQEIIGNLPKVWKVLMELLSHHKIERVQFEELPATADVQKATNSKTPELSVSKTYIKLKDLILEKKSLVKETNRLKTLNCHLDYRLNEQEKRLSAVSLELTKTWHLVGKMQRQHRQLHTQEQILRYQLQQKRRLLSELKDELEYCRRKWAAARALNDESQEQCDDLRREFARRKLEDANHSAESGYSDSGPQSDEELPAEKVGDAATGGTSEAIDGEAVAVASQAGNLEDAVSNCRRKHLRDQFEHTRRIKRMQSTSPGRAAAVANAEGEGEGEEIVLRWNSAPPTCGWREGDDEDEGDADTEVSEELASSLVKSTHSSRSKQRGKPQPSEAASSSSADSPVEVSGRTSRIQKLEEQCKSLIQQVLETSGNRERLEIQLCRFQDEIAPVQHAVPLDEFINRKRIERMTRASSAPATGTLTPREEEYTRKRSERLGRLEEESRQLMSRIKRTTDRGHYLKKSLDRIRRAPSREGSLESNAEDEPKKIEETKKGADQTNSPLTAEEEAYTARRAARIQRLEQESQQLLSQLSRNAQRSDTIANKLDTLHERHDQDRAALPTTSRAAPGISQNSVEQRLEDIERVSANRAERLRLLEVQGNELIARLSNTSERGTAMINRIAEREANRRQEAEVLEQAVEEDEATTGDLNSIASSRIVGDDGVDDEGAAACCVTVTTTSSQLAAQQSTGAIPKHRPTLQLCAATRQDDATRKRTLSKEERETEKKEPVVSESLEDMVHRLRALPFPTAPAAEEEEEEPQQQQTSESEIVAPATSTSEDAKDDTEKLS